MKTSQAELAMRGQAQTLVKKRDMKTPARIRTIVFVGTGSSYHCAQWAHWLCQLEGRGKIESRALSTRDFLDLPIAKADLHVVVSHRGHKDLTKSALERLQRKRHILLAAEGSPTGSHPTLFTTAPEQSNAHTRSVMAAMATLAELLARALDGKAEKKILKERALVARFLGGLSLDLLKTKAPVLPKSARLHFVGGGPSHVIAQELALKAQEMCHEPALAFNNEQFLHGPVDCLEKGDRVVLLSEDARIRAAARKARAVILEPHYGKPRPPHLSAPWLALLELYWGQIFCLATAERRRINCDIKRYEL